jgi:hypothetical protein
MNNPNNDESGRIIMNIKPSSKSISFKGTNRVNAIGIDGLNKSLKIIIIIIQKIIYNENNIKGVLYLERFMRV